MCSSESFYFLLREHGEDLDIALSIGIGSVDPILVELIRRSLFRIKPYVTAFGFAELGTIGFGDQWTSKGKGLSSYFTAN